MSRIGKQPIKIPEKVEVKVDGQSVVVRGPKGELSWSMPQEIKAEVKEKKLIIQPCLPVRPAGGPAGRAVKKTKKTSALWGLSRSLIFNMIQGVTEGFEQKLQLEGVGYRATLQGNKLVLSLGFSHPVDIEAPKGIEFKVEKNIITISGIDKQLVGQVAAEIRAKRKPEPYKGKGIRYLGEVVKRKAGKKAVATE